MQNKEPLGLTTIDPSALCAIILDLGYNSQEWLSENETHPKYDWILIEDRITDSYSENGGGYHNLVLKHISTDRFYETSYCDWDIDNTDFDQETGKVCGRLDLNCDIYEVKPKQITTTIYIRI